MKQKSLLLALFMLLGFSMANAKFEQLPKGKALASRPGISLPADVALGNAANFATIDKNGIGKRLKARRKAAEPVFSDDFESGNLDQWTIYTMGESPTANGWTLASNCGGYTAHSGTYYACSKSWTQGTGQGQIYSADNWLVTPLVSLGGKLSFWDKSDPNYPDLYEVLLSTTSNAISDFTTTLRPMQDANGEWTEVEVDLSAYKGQGYIAIHHVSSDKFHLHIDDFCVYPSEGKDFDVADLVGDYIWDYKTSSELATDLSSVTTTAGQARVKIALSEKTEGGITISGMFPNDLEATVESDGSYFVIEQGQVAGTYSSNSDYVLKGLFYYEGDENYEAGWYYSDIYGDIADDGSIHFDDWICRVLSGGDYDGYTLTPYYIEGSTLTPTEPLIVVEAPEGLKTEDYVISARNYSDDADVNGTLLVGFDGNDVYIQGLCTYFPKAWVKGTLDGSTVTFAYGQYFGNLNSSYDIFLNTLLGKDVVFDYDAGTGTLTAQNEVFLVDNNSDRYVNSYRGAVLKKVVEKAVMPANPEITSMKESTSYGWYFIFDVPLVDVNGDALAASKLSYMIYTDIEGEVAPLTFTPATHKYLTEDMTEIPYGFTDNWDFDPTYIYLNELYSEDWNKIGIQSIYRGGGEVNATDIQWLTIKPYANAEAIDPDGLTFNFEDGTMQGWTTIDADGDGYNWMIASGGVPPRGGEGYAVYSQSYDKDAGALTPDNFLVSPKLKLGAPMKFYACAQDASYPEEHFAVAVSTAGNTDAADFTNVREWTLEASPAARARMNARAMSRGPRKVQGNWYEYTVDLSAYEGQEGYVAIRHFNVTDQFYIVVDDISFGEPAFSIVPEEGVVESLQNFEITFSKFEVVAEGATATLTNTTTETSMSGSIECDGNTLTITFEETTEPGDYTLTIEGVKKAETGETVELSFNYTIEEQPVVVELPDGAEVNTWYLAAYDSDDVIVNREVGVAIVDNDIYVQGLCDYLPEAWVKGTIDGGTATFASGQFYGTYNESVNLFFVGFGEAMGDNVVCTYDAENGLLTTEDYICLAGDQKGNQLYEYYYSVEISRDRPDSFPVEAPEGLETETYLFTASCLEAGKENWEDYSYQVQVGFDGNEVYISGLNSDCAEYWMKGKLSEDGKTVTIPASQYMGRLTFWDYIFDYYITAKDEENNMIDVVLNYDAESSTFTTDQTVVLNGSKSNWEPYQTFTSVKITKMQDLAATPADPIFESYDFEKERGYNKIYASIPTVDVDGNALLTSKLFYTVWIEMDGYQSPYIFTAALYSKDFDEDVTEVPYSHDGYDLYAGGEIIYFEDEPEVLTTWSKVGIQSIYYGGGERRTSNIVWVDNSVYDPTGIWSLHDGRGAADDVIYNLSGQRLSKAQKGINIVRGKKVLVK